MGGKCRRYEISPEASPRLEVANHQVALNTDAVGCRHSKNRSGRCRLLTLVPSVITNIPPSTSMHLNTVTSNAEQVSNQNIEQPLSLR